MTMTDPTEEIRREMIAEVNADQRAREELEAEYGQCWNTDELSKDFEVLGFAAPFVIVRRKSDGVKGSLLFRHNPRHYFKFSAA